MSEHKIYYLIIDITNNRLIGGHFTRSDAKAKAEKLCTFGERWLIIETTTNIKDLEVWKAIYPVAHLE
jgi:hypothetical protein